MIKYKTILVETDIGNFKCYIYKIRMSKDFRIYCKQISVKVNNNHYKVNKELDRLTYDINKNNYTYDEINKLSPVIFNTIILEKLTYSFIVHSFNYVKYNIENFEHDLILKFKGGY